MNYRLALQTDIPSLVEIETGQPRCAQWGKDGWKTELAEKSAYVVCAEENTVVCGFLALRLAAGVCEILNVGVSRAYVRRGIGSGLMRQALDWVRQQGGAQITLEVGAHNEPAVQLYLRTGFTRLGVRKNFYAGNEDALLLGKTV